MRIAVLSGKGGAGKTLTAVNLAAAAGRAVYVDCDVEEPDGALFLKPSQVKRAPVCVSLPAFEEEKCSGCRSCVDFCRFHALVYVKGRPRVFPEVCHSCGGCSLVCPKKAVRETEKEIGYVEEGTRGSLRVITGVLHPGEASGVPVIKRALETAGEEDVPILIDCPPGSACPVLESVSGADYCILVAEPTAFGFHNFRMVYELVSLLHKPCGVIVNKQEEPYEPLEAFCREQKLPILLRIPYSRRLAELTAEGGLALEEEAYAERFREVLKKIGGMAE